MEKYPKNQIDESSKSGVNKVTLVASRALRASVKVFAKMFLANVMEFRAGVSTAVGANRTDIVDLCSNERVAAAITPKIHGSNESTE